MLRLILRLRPSAAIPCSRTLPGPALSSRSGPGACHLKRYHSGVRSRAVCNGVNFNTIIFTNRTSLLQCPQSVSCSQSKRCYSLPPHQKVIGVAILAAVMLVLIILLFYLTYLGNSVSE